MTIEELENTSKSNTYCPSPTTLRLVTDGA